MNRTLCVVVLLLAGCPKRGDNQPPASTEPAAPTAPAATRDAGPAEATPSDAAVVQLPPAPPLPAVPAGLPAAPRLPWVTPAAVALGELLFHDPRLSITGAVSCASCHVPANGYAGAARHATAAGKPNLRRAPTLVNLAWARELAWDGRYASITDHLPSHIRGQLGEDLTTSLTRIAELPRYRAHLTRVGGAPAEAALVALGAFALTRYAGGSPWDRLERDPAVPAQLKAGYQLFTGAARCSQCHTPPLYTDHGYHRLGLIALPDDGRARIEHARAGAFKTPTVRGAARRGGFFHDASATTLGAAIDWHLAGGTGQGADPSIVELTPITLTPGERAALQAFVEGLTAAGPPPSPPTLP